MNVGRVKKILTILFIVALIGVAAAFYFGWNYYQLKNISSGTSEQEINDLVTRVSRLMVLPTDENPTIATVSKPEELKDQPFFAKAKAGDKVLIYAKAGRAILYDPEADKIVEVAPINLGAAGADIPFNTNANQPGSDVIIR